MCKKRPNNLKIEKGIMLSLGSNLLECRMISTLLLPILIPSLLIVGIKFNRRATNNSTSSNKANSSSMVNPRMINIANRALKRII